MYIFGLRRTGNHAIINWLHGHCSTTSEHFNNQRLSQNLLWEPKTSTPRELVTVSFEEQKLPGSRPFILNEKILGEAKSIQCAVVMRDPFNLFASRFKHKPLRKQTIARMRYFTDLWKGYAREYLGQTQILPNCVPVSFNKWFYDEAYREELSRAFGFVSSSNVIEGVSPKGHGSSFDGLKYNGRAQEMKVLERWRHLAKDRQYRKIFEDEELIKLSDQIFGGFDEAKNTL